MKNCNSCAEKDLKYFNCLDELYVAVGDAAAGQVGKKGKYAAKLILRCISSASTHLTPHLTQYLYLTSLLLLDSVFCEL